MIRYIDFTEQHEDGSHTRYQHYNADDAYLITLQDKDLKTTAGPVKISQREFTQRIKTAMMRDELQAQFAKLK